MRILIVSFVVTWRSVGFITPSSHGFVLLPTKLLRKNMMLCKKVTYASEALGDPSIKQAVVNDPDLPFVPGVHFEVKLSCV
jgi:hypothetical protein